MHARWWGDPPVDTLSWLPRWGQDLPQRAQRYGQTVGPFLARFGERIPTRARALIADLIEVYVPLFSELARAPATIIHGDLHLDNVIFGSPECDTLVWVLDWQGVLHGPAVRDLVVLAGSLSIDQRRTWEQRLLMHYHETLVAAGVADYPLELLNRHYQLSLLAQLAAVVPWLATVDRESLVGRECALVEATIATPRLLTALLDHHVEQLIVR